MISYNISTKTKIERVSLLTRRFLYILLPFILMLLIYISLAFFGSKHWLAQTNKTVEVVAPQWIKTILGWIKDINLIYIFWIWLSVVIVLFLNIVGICVFTHYATYDTHYSPKVEKKKLQKLKYKQLKLNNKK